MDIKMTIQDRIIECINKNRFVHDVDFSNHVPFQDQLKMDSLDIVDLAISFNEEFPHIGIETFEDKMNDTPSLSIDGLAEWIELKM